MAVEQLKGSSIPFKTTDNMELMGL